MPQSFHIHPSLYREMFQIAEQLQAIRRADGDDAALRAMSQYIVGLEALMAVHFGVCTHDDWTRYQGEIADAIRPSFQV